MWWAYFLSWKTLLWPCDLSFSKRAITLLKHIAERFNSKLSQSIHTYILYIRMISKSEVTAITKMLLLVIRGRQHRHTDYYLFEEMVKIAANCPKKHIRNVSWHTTFSIAAFQEIETERKEETIVINLKGVIWRSTWWKRRLVWKEARGKDPAVDIVRGDYLTGQGDNSARYSSSCRPRKSSRSTMSWSESRWTSKRSRCVQGQSLNIMHTYHGNYNNGRPSCLMSFQCIYQMILECKEMCPSNTQTRWRR